MKCTYFNGYDISKPNDLKTCNFFRLLPYILSRFTFTEKILLLSPNYLTCPRTFHKDITHLATCLICCNKLEKFMRSSFIRTMFSKQF